MLSVDEARALSEVHPEFKPILDSGSPILQSWNMDTDIHKVRAMLAQMRQTQPRPDPSTLSYTTKDIYIPLRDGLETAARVYKPRGASVEEGRPGLVVFHGGGYLVGDLDTEAWLCALFTGLGGIAIDVDYRHAPEHVFPQAIHDAFDATKWVARNAQRLGIAPDKGLLVGGESSGADMALVVAQLCHDGGMSPPLTGVFAPIPSGVSEETLPQRYKEHFFSKQQNADAPMFSADSVKFIQSCYKPDQKSHMAFPVGYRNHTGLPKTYFQVCGLDPVRDCGLVLEKVYEDAGVPTRLDIYPGLPHAFWAFFPQFEIGKRHTEDTKEGLEWLLAAGR